MAHNDGNDPTAPDPAGILAPGGDTTDGTWFNPDDSDAHRPGINFSGVLPVDGDLAGQAARLAADLVGTLPRHEYSMGGSGRGRRFALSTGDEGDATWQVTGQVPPLETADPPGAAPGYVGLPLSELLRHTYVEGSTGSGKSWWVLGQVAQHLRHGRGVSVFDGKGDLAEELLDQVPREREGQVIWFDPARPAGRRIGLNMLTGRGQAQRDPFAALDLLPAMDSLAERQRLLAALDWLQARLPQATIFHVLTLLQETAGRAEMAPQTRRRTLPSYHPPPAGEAAWTPLITLINHPAVRGSVGQMAPTVDWARLLDTGGIFLGRVPPDLGAQPHRLLGTLAWQHLARALLHRTAPVRCPHMVYLDEAINFLTTLGGQDALTTLLKCGRAVGGGLVVTAQDGLQFSPEMLSTLRANTALQVFFRAGGLAAWAEQGTLTAALQQLTAFQMLQRFEGGPGQPAWQHLAQGLPAPSPLIDDLAPVPDAVAGQLLLQQWRTPPILDADALAVGSPITDRLRPRPGEAAAEARQRIEGLYQLVHGVEAEDAQLVAVLCALTAEDWTRYQQIRREYDQRQRAAILAHPGLIPDKRARIQRLSDLAHGTPPVEVAAVIARTVPLSPPPVAHGAGE